LKIQHLAPVLAPYPLSQKLLQNANFTLKLLANCCQVSLT